jgi:translation elongation factor P
MISTNDFRTGTTVEIDGNAWQVVEFQHVKPGKGAAFVRAKMKNLQTGAMVERTFNAGEKMPKAHVDRKVMEFLYEDGGEYHVMDTESFEQTALTKEQLGSAINFLKENMQLTVLVFHDVIFSVELPISVELEVTETDPAVKGDTATGASKMAVLETGYSVKVPLFINNGDVLRIDTRNGDYIERA